MPTPGVSMRKIKTILRLHFESKLSQHQIAHSTQLSVGVVNKYIKRATAAGLNWPLPVEYEDEQKLQERLKPTAPVTEDTQQQAIDFPGIRRELQRKSVTLQLLWKNTNPRSHPPLAIIIFACYIENGKTPSHKVCVKRIKQVIKRLSIMQGKPLILLILIQARYVGLKFLWVY